MNKETLKDILREKPGYLKSGSKKLAKLFHIPRKYAKEAVKEVKVELEFPVTPFRRLFFDLETSPNIGLFWRAGYKLNITPEQILEERRIITVSWKWEHEDKVHHLNWDENKDDKALLEQFSKIMAQADEVIAHNGDRFDIPWMRTRCLMQGIWFPTYMKSLDTLKKVKSMFNFQSNSLNYIASKLGLGVKKDTGGYDLWKRLTINPTNTKGYQEDLDTMHEYCDHDVVLLEDVFHKILGYIKPNSHVGIAQGKDRASCPNCGDTETKYLNHTVTASGIVKRHMLCTSCTSDYIIGNQVFLKMEH